MLFFSYALPRTNGAYFVQHKHKCIILNENRYNTNKYRGVAPQAVPGHPACRVESRLVSGPAFRCRVPRPAQPEFTPPVKHKGQDWQQGQHFGRFPEQNACRQKIEHSPGNHGHQNL